MLATTVLGIEYYLCISPPGFELLGGKSFVLCNFVFLVLRARQTGYSPCIFEGMNGLGKCYIVLSQ